MFCFKNNTFRTLLCCVWYVEVCNSPIVSNLFWEILISYICLSVMFGCQIWKYLPDERELQIEKNEMSFFVYSLYYSLSALADRWVWCSKWLCLLPISEYYSLKCLFFGEFSIHMTTFPASPIMSWTRMDFFGCQSLLILKMIVKCWDGYLFNFWNNSTVFLLYCLLYFYYIVCSILYSFALDIDWVNMFL